MGLDKGTFLIRNRVPGVVFRHLIHVLGSLATQDDRAEGCLGQRGILRRTHPRGIPAAIVITEESVFGGSVKGTIQDMATGPTRQQILGVKAVGPFTERTEIQVGSSHFLFVPGLQRQILCWTGLCELGKENFHWSF